MYILRPVLRFRLARLLSVVARARAAAVTLLVLWCTLSVSGGVSAALCLDLGGNCSPPNAVLPGACHDQDGTDIDPGCGSCIDISVPTDTSFINGRPDNDLCIPMTTLLPAFAPRPSASQADALPCGGTVPHGVAASPSLRTEVLRV